MDNTIVEVEVCRDDTLTHETPHRAAFRAEDVTQVIEIATMTKAKEKVRIYLLGREWWPIDTNESYDTVLQKIGWRK